MSSGLRFPPQCSSSAARTRPARRASGPRRRSPQRRRRIAGKSVVAKSGRSDNPSGSPETGACMSLISRSHADVTTGANARRRKSSAAARMIGSKFPTEMMLCSSGTMSGFSCDAFSSIASCRCPYASASRAAPCTCGMQRKLSGSCRFRALPSSQSELPARSAAKPSDRVLHTRKRARRARRPGAGC